MNWNDPEFIESIRLINKFFPESKAFVQQESGISIYEMIESMKILEFQCDYSCDHFEIREGTSSSLSKNGGFDGENDEIYFRLLKQLDLKPKGRAVVIPDALGKGWSTENLMPFVCDTKTLPLRLNEIDDFFDESHDRILVFETGEAICIDHDLRVYWAISKINKRAKLI